MILPVAGGRQLLDPPWAEGLRASSYLISPTTLQVDPKP